jgi:hypothetical protein
MALEDLTGSGKYIDDLVSSNPAAGDNVSEGDDHIRGLKNVLKLSFPAITGAVTPTHTELNYVDGVTSAIQTQLNAITANNWVVTARITDANVTTDKIADANVTTAKIADDAVTNAKMGADAITGAEIADDAINSEHYVDGSIDTAHIGNNQVTAAKVAADVATQAELDTVSTVASAALPKAGGAMTGHITGGDNIYLKLGAGEDLQLHHDGSNSYIGDQGTGNLILGGSAISLKGGGDFGETLATFTDNGSVDLYHDNAKKFETYASGVQATGNVLSTTGIFGLDSNDNVEVGTSDINFNINGNNEMRLEADGDLHVDGDVIAFSTTISDEALKYDINPVEFALDKINQLRGVSYKYKHNDRESAGLLAQDVEKVMPSAVTERKLPLHQDDGKAYKTLHYDSLTAILVEAIKELTAKVKKLENR